MIYKVLKLLKHQRVSLIIYNLETKKPSIFFGPPKKTRGFNHGFQVAWASAPRVPMGCTRSLGVDRRRRLWEKMVWISSARGDFSLCCLQKLYTYNYIYTCVYILVSYVYIYCNSMFINVYTTPGVFVSAIHDSWWQNGLVWGRQLSFKPEYLLLERPATRNPFFKIAWVASCWK